MRLARLILLLRSMRSALLAHCLVKLVFPTAVAVFFSSIAIAENSLPSTVDPAAIVERLYYPPAGQWLISGRQLTSKTPIDSLFDSEETPRNATATEVFSVLLTQKGERFSLVFRPDSESSFSDLDHYWDGTVFAGFNPQTRALTLMPPGKKLDVPHFDLRYFLDFGHFGVRYYLTAPGRDTAPPIATTDTPNELVVELPPLGDKGRGRLTFLKIEDILVLD
jgi:hypothetical protein